MLRRTFITLAAAAGASLVAPARGFAQTDVEPATATPGGEGAEMHDLVVTRLFDAPVARVWDAWSDPEHVKRWWGPKGFTVPVAEIDFRVGGTSLVGMRSPDGHTLYNTWTHRKIVPLELIEFILSFADADGNRVTPAEVGLPAEIPPEVRHVITFTVVGDDRTEMTVTEYGYPSEEIVALSKAGLEETLDKMAASFTEPLFAFPESVLSLVKETRQRATAERK